MQDIGNRVTILFVHANNSDVGGADYCLFKLAAALNRGVFRPVVCLSEKTRILDLYHNAGITTHVIDMVRIRKSLHPLYLARLALKFIPTIIKLKYIIRHEAADIIHGNDLLDIYGPIAARISGKPSMQYIRMIIVSPGWLKFLLTYLVYLINHRILTVSDAVANAMFSRQGKVLPGVHTCYDWIDMETVGHVKPGEDIRAEYGIPQSASIVGAVGRLDYWKGHDVLLKAAVLVIERYPDTVFLIAGGEVKGRGRETIRLELEQLSIRLGINDNVIFTGHREDVFNLMHCMDIFVHSSVAPDPLPGVVMEAQYCELPVVGTDAGGVPEEIEDRKTGLLYEMGNYHDLADKIAVLVENKAAAKAMGRLGRARTLAKFDRKKLCGRVEKIYSELAQLPRSDKSLTTGHNSGGHA